MPASLLRFFGLQNTSSAERRAAVWIAAMFFFAMASTALLRPLRDQFGVKRGVDYLPHLYSLTLIATVVAVLPFWWLANRSPSRRFVPIVVNVCTAGIALLAIGLGAIGEYDWNQVPWLGEWFWGGFSALNVILPALVWIHAVEHFRTEQARRVFGLVAIGGTLGVVVGSFLAGWIVGEVVRGADGRPDEKWGLFWPPWASAVVSVVLLQCMAASFRVSIPACAQLGGAARDDVARGGVLEGVRILAGSRRAQAIGLYMMLLGVLATAFAAAQTELVGKNIADDRAQHVWLANVEFWGQSLVLTLQLLCTGRLLQRWPGSVLLISLPVVSIVGLLALHLAPALHKLNTINLVQIGRRGAQYSFEKPAREVLYTPLSLATKHKVKFLLDTFAFRLGDLAGAWLAVGLIGWRNGVWVTIAIALAWIVLGVALGRRQPPSMS